ncbi:MAG: hypothetical protein AVDCRST_MAG40-762, partial [uncultured Gemmatimonadaceae bacterium]
VGGDRRRDRAGPLLLLRLRARARPGARGRV